MVKIKNYLHGYVGNVTNRVPFPNSLQKNDSNLTSSEVSMTQVITVLVSNVCKTESYKVEKKKGNLFKSVNVKCRRRGSQTLVVISYGSSELDHRDDMFATFSVETKVSKINSQVSCEGLVEVVFVSKGF